jgi:hypothetical protein
MRFVTFDYAEIDIEQVKAGYSEGTGALRMFVILFRDNSQMRLSDIGGAVARDFRRFTQAFQKGVLDEVLSGLVADDAAGKFAEQYGIQLDDLRAQVAGMEPLLVNVTQPAAAPSVRIVNRMPKVLAQHVIVFTEDGLATGSQTTYEYEPDVPQVGETSGIVVVNEMPRVKRETRTINRDSQQVVIGATAIFEYDAVA